MLIGELARKSGLTLHTIRFYEKRGLLNTGTTERRENNYKEYSPEALERLHFIAQAKSAGFTLRETSELLLEWHALDVPTRRKVILDKIKQIGQRRAELDQMQAHLSKKLAGLPPEEDDGGTTL